MSVDIFTAFFAGIASFFAPCSLATLPIFLTNIASASGEDLITDKGRKKIVLRKVVWYAAGFTLVFILLGIGVSGISRYFIQNQSTFSQLSGVVLIILASFILFGHKFKRLSFLYASQKKVSVDIGKLGFTGLTPFILGIANGFSWSPCIGPILGSILMLAGSNANLGYGVVLLLVYSIGITTPMVIFAGFFDIFAPKMKVLLKYGSKIYKAGAIIIMIIGFLLLIGWYDDITGFFYRLISFQNNAS